MQTETMGVDPNYVSPKKERIESLVLGWCDSEAHRAELLDEIKRLWEIEQAPGREWLRQVRAALWRHAPLWLYTLYLKAQLLWYAIRGK